MAFSSDCLVRSGQSISAVMSCVPQALQAVVQLCKSQFSISKMIKKEEKATMVVAPNLHCLDKIRQLLVLFQAVYLCLGWLMVVGEKVRNKLHSS